MNLFETEFWNVSLDPNHTYLGRSYIKLKRNCGAVSDVKKEEWAELIDIIKKLEFSIKKAFGTTMFNLNCFMNNSYKQGITPQVHFHLVPRYDHSVEFAGETFEDPEFGGPYSVERKKIISEEVSKKIAEEINSHIQT